MFRALIIDEHAIFRAGLRRTLEIRSDIAVSGETASVEAAITAVSSNPPDLVFLDISVDRMIGLDAITRLLQIAPKLRIIVVTSMTNDPLPAQAISRGALGFVDKRADADEILDAVDAVSRGQRFIAARIAQQLTLANLQGTDDESVLDQLTAREMQILLMITTGQCNKQISCHLLISPKTVSTHRKNMLRKLGVRSDVELTHFALRHGLVAHPA